MVDNTACGPAIGGVRMAPDASLEECARLARAMTLKNAAAGLTRGGGKSMIFGDPRLPAADKQRVIRVFACAMRDLVDYIPGPDLGTDEACMAWVRDEIGRAVGLPAELGGNQCDGFHVAARGAGRSSGTAGGIGGCNLGIGLCADHDRRSVHRYGTETQPCGLGGERKGRLGTAPSMEIRLAEAVVRVAIGTDGALLAEVLWAVRASAA